MSADKISRKAALKRLSGLALGSTLFPSAVLEAKAASKGVPNIIRRRKGDKPNIVWITLEGVPLSVLSCYGSRLIETPHIDRVAREGMRFRNAFTTNALCGPSRATLLTGKYDHLNGMITNPGLTTPDQPQSCFDPAQQTFAQILNATGTRRGWWGSGTWWTRRRPPIPGLQGSTILSSNGGAGGPYYQADRLSSESQPGQQGHRT